MKKNDTIVLLGKILLAGFLISALITYAIKTSGNVTPAWLIMAIALGALLAGLGLLTLMVIPFAEFQQWKLRQGATDTQWLFFNQDPPGFESEKSQC